MNEILSRAIAGYKHIDYARTVELATYYEQVATGVGQGELVINYKPRETAQQKVQRVEITQNRTKSPYGKVRGFYRRVFRADKLKFEVKHKDESKVSQINELQNIVQTQKHKMDETIQVYYIYTFPFYLIYIGD